MSTQAVLSYIKNIHGASESRDESAVVEIGVKDVEAFQIGPSELDGNSIATHGKFFNKLICRVLCKQFKIQPESHFFSRFDRVDLIESIRSNRPNRLKKWLSG